MKMKSRNRRFLVTAALAGLATAALASGPIRHRMTIELDPTRHSIKVVDQLTLSEAGAEQDREFLLNAALTITEASIPVSRVPLGDVDDFYGINGSSAGLSDQIELARYRLDSAPEGGTPHLSPSGGTLVLSWEGAVHFGLSDPKEEYTRGFRETAGMLDEEGVYLSGGGFWYPFFNDDLVEFAVEVGIPEGWHVISQGNGSSRDAEGRAHWDSHGPMDEIYLVGGPLEVYREAAGAVEALVYLRQRDDSLAGKYLGATAQYLEMYRNLIGTYPYEKFALVENFWETGYGMPSFTLLGSQVIRFPFILHSSYPHEILHNWWGNSVFVDYLTGNWCEGLTAYMADHLIQEQRGKGQEYRRGILQKYRDYVKEGRDFPLTEFRSRHSAATEAVGYGKTAMVFHMLRRRVGDQNFSGALQRFYREHRGKKAAFADVRKTFEGVTGEELGWFFDEWVTRPGAASLSVSIAGVREEDGSFRIEGSLEQLPGGESFVLEVPMVVQTAAGAEATTVRIDDVGNRFVLSAGERPLALHVDPEFDVFRLLDPRETPPSIGQIFGEPEILAVVPAAAGEDELKRYRKLMAGWRSNSHAIEVRSDTEVQALPDDRGVWILGRENLFATGLFRSDPELGVELGPDGLTIQQEEIPFEDHSLVWIRRHPANLEKAVGWLVVTPPEAFAGMARKLPHYGKYSYLGFVGEEPTNVVKGQWPATDSPLRVDLRPAGERHEALPPLVLEARTALAELPPVFSQKTLEEHVAYLSAPEREGRGIGSAGLLQAAAYVEAQFKAAGLRPGGDDDSYRQELTLAEGPDGQAHVAVNLIGYLPGSRAQWSEQSVLVTAHYDHLGRGWPDVHQGDEGKIHPGADDNASGVAVLLELAKSFAAAEPPLRNLVFVAFSAEEAGKLGSRHFAEHPSPFPLEGTMGVVNLDTVGRLFDQKLSVLGTGTASEWQHIFRGVSYVTGVESKNIPGMAEASDQESFILKGVPGVQIFTQPHTDYHRPSDTPEKIDGAGLVKVATFVKEAVSYLVEREEPMTLTIGPHAATRPTASGPTQGRKVRFGSIPDFAFAGPGVKLSGVVPGSPAEKAGLRESDVLLRMDATEITNLQTFSEFLKTLTPGRSVTVTIRRGDQELAVETTVEAR
ncbi:MAG: M20/M25/M40 family metallo-hydrolase [bacterium]|nr:M20/M25/M40 family metallo-hydrolase [bacterium]